jgi:hypothetical protein
MCIGTSASCNMHTQLHTRKLQRTVRDEYLRNYGVIWFTKCNVNSNDNDLHLSTVITSFNRPILISSVVSNYGWT